MPRETMNDRPSVRDFGAIGDGVTDCTDAFQTAVNAASAETLAVNEV